MMIDDITGWMLDNTELSEEKINELAPLILDRLCYKNIYEQIEHYTKLFTEDDADE